MRRWLAAATALTGVLAAAAGTVAAQGATAVEIHKVDEGHFVPVPGAPVFFLAVGSDARPGQAIGRADALHVIGVNPAAGEATILNIPRDTYVPVPGRGTSKINDAYVSGGPSLQAETVERLTGVDISFVLTTRFEGLEGMVNEMGGVEVDVPVAMSDRASGAFFPKGRVHMDGPGALAFSRNRHTPGGDFARTTHQGVLILAALSKLRAAGTGPAATFRYLAVLGRHTRMDGVSLAELYRLGRLGLSIDPARVRNVTMPGSTGSAGAQSVVFASPSAQALFADLRDDAVLQAH